MPSFDVTHPDSVLFIPYNARTPDMLDFPQIRFKLGAFLKPIVNGTFQIKLVDNFVVV